MCVKDGSSDGGGRQQEEEGQQEEEAVARARRIQGGVHVCATKACALVSGPPTPPTPPQPTVQAASPSLCWRSAPSTLGSCSLRLTRSGAGLRGDAGGGGEGGGGRGTERGRRRRARGWPAGCACRTGCKTRAQFGSAPLLTSCTPQPAPGVLLAPPLPAARCSLTTRTAWCGMRRRTSSAATCWCGFRGVPCLLGPPHKALAAHLQHTCCCCRSAAGWWTRAQAVARWPACGAASPPAARAACASRALPPLLTTLPLPPSRRAQGVPVANYSLTLGKEHTDFAEAKLQASVVLLGSSCDVVVVVHVPPTARH